MSNLDLIKKLREESGAGILACQNALKESNNDYDKAYDILRKQGASKAMSKLDRATAEGLCCIVKNEGGFSIVKLNCETDFVAKNEKFQNLAKKIADVALLNNITNVEALLQQTHESRSVQDLITESIASIGENIVLSEVKTHRLNQDEVISYYVHNKIEGSDCLGAIVSTIIATGCSNNNEQAMQLLKQINMHITAMSPIALSEDQVDSEVISREKAIYEEQVSKLNKPANIAEKMIEGKLHKFFEEKVLLKQMFVLDNKNSVENVLANFNKDNNSQLKIISFDRVSIK